MIVSISGKLGSGKDTVGEIIQYLTTDIKHSYRYKDYVDFNVSNLTPKDRRLGTTWEIKKFADKLKDIVCLLIGCTREQLEDREFKEKELSGKWWYYLVSYIDTDGIGAGQKLIPYGEAIEKKSDYNYTKMLIKLTPRKLLQILGTECGRNIIHPNIWCNSLFSKYIGDIEKWKDINNYEGLYQISSFGNVRSLDREVIYGNKSKGEYHNRKGQLLKASISGGYENVSLSGKTFTIHSLVGEHFLNKPNGDFVLNHKDYNKTNNFYKNLEYVSQGDNVRHNYLTGNANIGVKQKDAKLNKEQVLKIKKLLKTDTSQNKIAKQFNVSPTTICDIKKGRKWKHIGQEKIKIKPILPIKTPNWIITDMRFPNELKAVKDRGGISIRVNRVIIPTLEDCKNNLVEYLPTFLDGTVKSKSQFDKGVWQEYIYQKGDAPYLERALTGKNMQNGICGIRFKQSIHKSETALDNAEFDYTIDNNGTIEELVEKVKQILIKEKIL